MIDHGRMHENDEVKIDYFAVSLPDLLIFEDDLDAVHFGAHTHLKLLTVI